MKGKERINEGGRDKEKKKQKVAVIPYLHALSHNLKEVMNKAKVKVVFSAPEKLANICNRVNPPSKTARTCSKKHRKQFVPCQKEVIYSIPLTCGDKYIGQTGRCSNDRLRERNKDVEKGVKGHIAARIVICSACHPEFENCKIIGSHSDQISREAFNIKSNKYNCVSAPSVVLSEKEVAYLSRKEKRKPMNV